MKALIIITTMINILLAQDFTDISKDDFQNKSVPIPKINIEQSINQAQEFVFHVIENGQNIIRDLLISNPKRELTIMVFMNAKQKDKSNLEGAGQININDMERIGSSKDVNIIAEFGRIEIQDDTNGKWIGVRRYYIKKDTDTSKITSPIVYSKTGPNASDMGDFQRVIDFVKWAKKKFPANRYMLILWDHGTGWLDPVKKKKSQSKGISFDDETGNYITTEEIGKILKSIGGVDILAYDACLMQTAEVLTEAKDYTKVIIGSEELVPGYGYPYALFLKPIVENPKMSNEDIARAVVKAFTIFYTYYKIEATNSAIRANKIDGFLTKLSEFAKAIMKTSKPTILKKVREEVLRFNVLGEQGPAFNSFFADVYDIAKIIKENSNEQDIIEKAGELMSYMDNELIIEKGFYGANSFGKSYAFAGGVSIYFPPVSNALTYENINSLLITPYDNYKLSKLTGWNELVKFVFEKTK